MRRDVSEERRDVHCLSASLSEQDFESVGELSARAVRDSAIILCFG